jgi:hypothetical protein
MHMMRDLIGTYMGYREYDIVRSMCAEFHEAKSDGQNADSVGEREKRRDPDRGTVVIGSETREAIL